MQLLGTRKDGLRHTMEGHDRSSQELVAWNDGFLPSGYSDDPGLYYWAPKLARALNLDVVTAAHVLFSSWAIVCSIVGLWGMFCLFQSRGQRVFATVGLGLFLAVMLLSGDVYVIPAGLLIASIPWLILHGQARRPHRHHVIGFMAFGALAGIAHTIRFQSWVPLAVALLALWAIRLPRTWQTHGRQAIVLGVVGLAAFALPLDHLSAHLDERDEFLAASGVQANAVRAHPTWHSIYIGLGYIDNPFGIEYRDENAAAKVASIDPDVEYVSAEYDAILKMETIDIATNYPSFILELLAAKAGVVLLYAAIFGNVGWVAAAFRPRRWEDGLFLMSGVASMAWGMVAVPNRTYLLPFMAMSVLFGMWSVNRFMEDRGPAWYQPFVPPRFRNQHMD